MSEPRCGECGTLYVRRAPVSGIVERLASLVYLYPFRCQLCTHRFQLLQWGVRYQEAGADKREYERIEIKFPVGFTSKQGTGEGIATDISLTGCRLETDIQLPVGAVLQMQLRTSDRKPPLTLQARVVRTIRPCLLGMKFVRLSQDQRDQITTLVTTLLGLPPIKRP